MSSPPLTAVCPQCSREVPRLDADPDGGWEKCEHCNGIFLVLDEINERPPGARIDIVKERERLTLTARPRTSPTWRMILCYLTALFSLFLTFWIPATLEQTETWSIIGHSVLALFYGTATYLFVKKLFREENYSFSLLFDDESVVFRRRLFPFMGRTFRVPMKEIVQLESRAIDEKKQEGERRLLFHYFDSRKRERLFSVYPASQVEERWILDELHEFLKSTPGGSPIVPFAHFVSHPSESLAVRAVGDTMFVRIYCPRCGMRIDVHDLDLASGKAICRQKNCDERFIWWETPPPSEHDPEIRRRQQVHENYSDVRAFHFANAADPFESSFEPRRPLLSRQQRHLAVSRPSIYLDKDRLTIRVKGIEPFNAPRFFGGVILAVGFAGFALTMLVLSLAAVVLVFQGGLNEEFGVPALGGILFCLFLCCLPFSFFYGAILHLNARHWGEWALTLDQASLRYRRRSLGIRRSWTVPLDRLTGFYVIGRKPTMISFLPEEIANHLVRFDVGRKSYYFPCGSEEHRNWVASEIVEFLAVRGWDAGDGIVRRS